VNLHVIPVPHGWSPEQSWEAQSRGVDLTDPDPDWAVIEVEGGSQVGDRWLGGRLVRLVPVDDDD
jgi:hypothetical protein